MSKEKLAKIMQTILWGSGLFLLLFLTLIWYKVIEYDSNSSVISKNDNPSNIELQVTGGHKSADFWETDIQLSDNPYERAHYTGETFSVQIANNHRYDIKDWQLKFNVNKECFLNGFWCGSVEVHQFRDGKELVNVLNTSGDDISNLEIDQNRFSDKLMLRLLPGDYLVYFPSEKEHEDVVNSKSSVGIGFNLYYQNSLDFTDWTLTYMNDLKMTNVRIFRAFLVLLVLWLAALIQFICISSVKRKLKIEMNKKINDISILADLYLEAYMINISEDMGYLVKGTEGSLILDLVGENVQERLNANISVRCADSYREQLVEFCNLDTISQRMKEVSSVAFEYFDAKLGWCILHMFKVDGEDHNQVVLTLQDINEERDKLRQIEDRINTAEYKQSVGGSFMETVSYALDDITKIICGCGAGIMNQSTQDEVKVLADQIVRNTKHMNMVQNTMMDLYRIECKRFALNIETYNIYDMLEELCHIVTPFSEGKAYEFKIDIDDKMPASMRGDSKRIEQILVILLFSSLLMTREGFVKLSVYGKQHENEEEIIFSIRDTAGGFTKEQMQELFDFINGASIETFDNASLIYLRILNGILKYMGSELKVVSVFGEGSDFYFTLKQEIV